MTLAHLIANPDRAIFEKLGLASDKQGAIGILTITPSEAAIIAVDLASKAAGIEIGFVDRFSGSVVMTGDVSSVEAALQAVLQGLEEVLGFSSTVVTRT